MSANNASKKNGKADIGEERSARPVQVSMLVPVTNASKETGKPMLEKKEARASSGRHASIFFI